MHKNPYIQELLKGQGFFEINTEDVLGQSMEVFKNRPRSLVDFLDASANHADKPYLIYKTQTLTFSEHLLLIKKAAYILQHTFDVKPGDRVAIYASNRPEWIIFFWATVSIGAIACGINGWWKGVEAMKAIELADPKVVLVDFKRFERIEDLNQCPHLLIEDVDWNAHVEILDEFVRLDEDECACLLYTSGTTGTPKAVMTSHRSMIANSTLQMLQGAAVSQEASSKGIDWSLNSPVSLLTSPLFHVSGLSAGAVTSLFAGSTTLMYEGRFLAAAVLGLMEKYKVTSWGGAVPTTLKRVLDEAASSTFDLSSILVIGGGGAPMPPELIDRSKEIFPNSRYSFGYGYGLTESGAITLVNWGDELLKHPSSPGTPMPTIHIELRSEDGQLVSKDNVEAEIHVRSPSVMLGYFNNIEASNQTLTSDRWLKTGDWGYQKDGQYYISSRRTDLILRGAENVYPQEVELLLDMHPSIHESAVIGIPHDDLGQEVMAVIRCSVDGIDLEQVQAYLSDQLADFKVPSSWKVVHDPLPRNATGKLMKHVLIDASKNTMVNSDD